MMADASAWNGNGQLRPEVSKRKSIAGDVFVEAREEQEEEESTER